MALRPRSALPLRSDASLLYGASRLLQIKQHGSPVGHPVPDNRANTIQHDDTRDAADHSPGIDLISADGSVFVCFFGCPPGD